MRNLGGNIKGIATVLLSVTLLVSMIGLQMRFHQCDTSGTTEHIVSLAFMGDNNTADDFNCECAPVDAEVPHCENCTVDNPIPTSKDDCCESGSELFKLDLEYLVNSTHKVEMPKTLELLALASVFLFNNIEDQPENDIFDEIDPPNIPKAFGKLIVISNNQLKIPSA